MAAFKIYAIIKIVYCFNWLPWTSNRSSHLDVFLENNFRKSENIETLYLAYLLSALKEPVQIDYKKPCCIASKWNLRVSIFNWNDLYNL